MPTIAGDFCLVENGDLEECVIYEPTLADATARNQAVPWERGDIDYPILLDAASWDAFLDRRYAQRERNQEAVIGRFADYYELLRRRFIADGRYVRLAGNHDTYLDEPRERVLRDRIQEELGRLSGDVPAARIHDVLRVERGGDVDYVVTHGHQFDPACLQHTSVPYAKSFGEIFSECLGWAYQGPDRCWTLSDTKKWYIGDGYQNVLAREEPGTYQGGTDGVWDLAADAIDRIKEDPRDFIEVLLGAEIAWEYFENTNAFYALTLEVWTGDELYKMKHMNEIELCEGYRSSRSWRFRTRSSSIPEARARPHPRAAPERGLPDGIRARPSRGSSPTPAPGAIYLNSGSAGRYENLIWCVELRGDSDRICSWSRVDGKLKKITWKSEGDQLVHDEIEWF